MIEALIIAMLVPTVLMQTFMIARLTDRLRRLDTIIARHLSLDKRYILDDHYER